jgi:AbiU2
MNTTQFEILERLSGQIWSALNDLETNTLMWSRARISSLRHYGSSYDYESAVHCTVGALVERQIVILCNLWDKDSRDQKKGSLPLFTYQAKGRAAELARHIADTQLFETENKKRSFTRRSEKQINRLVEAIDGTQHRFDALLDAIRRVRNHAIAHNIFDNGPSSIDILKFRSLEHRTVHLARAVALIFDGPTRQTSVGLPSSRRRAIDLFWTRIEGDRSAWLA